MSDPGKVRPWTELDDFWTALVDARHDLPALLGVIADRVVDLLGDGCVVTTVSADGTTLQARAIVHADPDVAQAMRAALGDGDVKIGEGVAGRAAADQRTVILNDLAAEVANETTADRFRPFVREHPMRAIAVAPLLAGGDLVGTLGSVRTSSAAPYTLADVRLLESLAERAALAVADALGGPRAIGAADYEAIYRENLDGVLLTTPDGHILAANPAACAILGLTEQQILAGGREAIVVGEDPRLAKALAERAAVGRARAELSMRRGDGTVFAAQVSSTIFMTHDHKVRAAVIFRDISEEVAARALASARFAELERAADRDPLTGLLNRRGFAVAAHQALAAADRQGTVSQLVFLDVDHLKAINDAQGHSVGDAALVAVAAAIDRAIRDVDVACRLGGDEFVLLLLDTPVADLPAVVDRIRGELATDPDAPAGVRFSTGVAERPPDLESTVDELIDAADRDMYRQKVLQRLRGTETDGS